jgi:hypothetical protein
MAMDTAMTNNWHQPIQSIGSSKGDGVCFKHMMRVYFQPHANKIPLDLDKDVVYEMDENYYPTDDICNLAKLFAEHSASIPDHYSTSYLPVSAWIMKHRHLDSSCSAAESINPLLATSLVAGCGRKRGLEELQKAQLQMQKRKMNDGSSASSVLDVPILDNAGSISSMAKMCRDIIPEWIVAYLSKAVYANNGDIFSCAQFAQCPYNKDKDKGFPEFVLLRDIDGTSFNTKRLPCIAHMVLKNEIKVHGKNWGAMWVAKKAKDSVTKDKLVYMKCWHPTCKLKVDEYRDKVVVPSVGTVPSLFDCHRWALVCRKDLEKIIGSVEVDRNARI